MSPDSDLKYGQPASPAAVPRMAITQTPRRTPAQWLAFAVVQTIRAMPGMVIGFSVMGLVVTLIQMTVQQWLGVVCLATGTAMVCGFIWAAGRILGDLVYIAVEERLVEHAWNWLKRVGKVEP